VTEPAPAAEESDDPGRLPPFDRMHAVGDVQRQAIDSASHIIGRFLDMVERSANDRDPLRGPDGGDAEPGFHQLRADVARAVDLYVDLFRRTFESYAELTESALRRRGVTIDGDGSAPTGPLALEAVDGGVAEGALWLHNSTEATIGPERVCATGLFSHDGGFIPATGVVVEPPTLPPVAPRESVSAVVRIDVSGAPAGRYVGHLLTSQAALALRVDVRG
jgi:hypothetical protein